MNEITRADEFSLYNAPTGNSLDATLDAPRSRFEITGIQQGDRSLNVTWGDGHISRFHHIWLRHHCYCSICGDSKDGIRFILIPDIPADIRPASVTLVANNRIEIVWSGDDHRSEFGADWLRSYCYSDAERARRRCFAPKLWKADIAGGLPSMTYPKVAGSETALLSMFESLRDYGIVHLRDVGLAPEGTTGVAKLIGPIHETTENGTIYDVQSNPVSEFGAATAMEQHPHSDDPFAYSPPGIDIFHCVRNAREDGGESVYVDSFAIAEALRAEEPRSFELLSTVPITQVRCHPGEVDFRCRGTVIRLDDDANVAGVRYFDRGVAPLDVPEDLVEEMYEAQRHFIQRIMSPEFVVQLLIPEGDAIILDNHRVMHGRRAFSPKSQRRIRLCFIDRDEFHARWRDLSRRMGRLDHDMILPSGALAVP